MDKLNSISQLRSVLRKMERDIGLDGLSAVEKDVFLAAHSLTRSEGDVVASARIRAHSCVKNIAPATYHRALRTLLKMGFLELAGDSKTKSYVIRCSVLGG